MDPDSSFVLRAFVVGVNLVPPSRANAYFRLLSPVMWRNNNFYLFPIGER